MHSIVHVIFFPLNSETVIACAESSPSILSARLMTARELSARLMTARATLRAWLIRPSYRFGGGRSEVQGGEYDEPSLVPVFAGRRDRPWRVGQTSIGDAHNSA